MIKPKKYIGVLLANILSVILLTACGGGGGSGNTLNTPTKASTENLCAIPRTGIDPETRQPYLDKPGSLAIEKQWVTVFVKDTYLWYKELPAISEASYTNPVDYFLDFKSPVITASGKLRDRFHFTLPSQEWYNFSQTGESVDYGVTFVVTKSSPPRNVVISMVDPQAPAAHRVLTRGMKLLSVDGIDAVNTVKSTEIDTLNAAIFPNQIGEQHRFTFATADGTGTQTLTMTAGLVGNTAVPIVKVLNTNSGKIGYIQFNEFVSTAQLPLMNAVSQLKQANITDLVLDIRYNGGGYNSMSSQVAYMLAATAKTQGKVFERIESNDKNPFGWPSGQRIYPFINSTIDYGQGTAPAVLPNLGLNRVYVLTTARTASASEALINGLRGVDVEVVLIGNTTAGKPYGFFPQDNCGTTYFNIQIKGSNQKGFSDYADGFPAQCSVADDFSKRMGDPTEKMLAQALHYQQFGVCNPALSKTSNALEPALSKTSDNFPLLEDRRLKTQLRQRRYLTLPFNH